MKKIILMIFTLVFVNLAVVEAQNNGQLKSATGKGIIYDRERIFLGEGNTNGFTLGYQWGKLRTYYKTTFYQIAIGGLKNSKETKKNVSSSNGGFSFGETYVYGKQNTLMKAHLIYGEKRFFTEKDAQRGVAVGMSYAIGPQAGLLKPYYILYFDGTDIQKAKPISYSEANAKKFLDGKANGAATFSTGLNEIKILPSLHTRVGLHFDWGAYEEYIRALEVGFSADIFAKKVPIMVNNSQNRPFFLNFYANLQLGKRK
jgi:hypothetical protein